MLGLGEQLGRQLVYLRIAERRAFDDLSGGDQGLHHPLGVIPRRLSTLRHCPTKDLICLVPQLGSRAVPELAAQQMIPDIVSQVEHATALSRDARQSGHPKGTVEELRGEIRRYPAQVR